MKNLQLWFFRIDLVLVGVWFSRKKIQVPVPSSVLESRPGFGSR
jgi:hypothetical protein